MDLISNEFQASVALAKKFAAVIDVMPDMVFIVDAEGTYLDAFSGAGRPLVAPREQLVGKKLSDFFDPEFVRITTAKIGQTLKDGLLTSHEYELNIGGSLRHFEVRISRIDSTQVLAVVSDLTEKHQMALENKMQQAKLVEASRLAKVGEMASGIAHEINNPLAIISGYASAIQREIAQGLTLDPARLNSQLERINVTVHRISKIVSGLQIFGGDAAREIPSAIPVKNIVEEVLMFCQEKFVHNGVRIELEIEDENHIIEVRKFQISQVLLNLLVNSFHAIETKPENEKWIRLKAFKNEALKSYQFQIIDSGLGIPAAQADRLFQPFYTTKAVGKGTGLGLSISKGIVESHGGDLYLDQKHINTCFVVNLPNAIV